MQRATSFASTILHFPAWLGEVVLDRFQVGNTRLKLRFSRTGAACAVDVLEQEGDPIRVLVELAPNT